MGSLNSGPVGLLTLPGPGILIVPILVVHELESEVTSPKYPL